MKSNHCAHSRFCLQCRRCFLVVNNVGMVSGSQLQLNVPGGRQINGRIALSRCCKLPPPFPFHRSQLIPPLRNAAQPLLCPSEGCKKKSCGPPSTWDKLYRASSTPANVLGLPLRISQRAESCWKGSRMNLRRGGGLKKLSDQI